MKEYDYLIVGAGLFGSYRYCDMDKVIRSAPDCAENVSL